MANLSNINGKFVVEQTTGYVGVGTTDPNYPIEVLNASAAEIALNASGGSIYRLRSDSTDSFRINKNGVGDRLVIDGSGNSTFAGTINSGAITSTGKITGTELEGTSLDINGNGDISGTLTVHNTLTVNKSQGTSALTINNAGNGGWTQYASTNDGVYGYIGSGSHLLAPVVNDNDFVLRAQGEFAVSIAAAEKMRINSSGNATFAGALAAGATTLTSTNPSILVLNPTASNYGGITFKYGGVTKGTSIYNSGSMVYGGEVGTFTRLQSGGQYCFHADATNQNVHIGGTTDTTYKLQVTGTTYTSGNATFAGDITLTPGNSNKIILTPDVNSHYITGNGYWVDVVGNAAEVFRVFGGVGGTSEYFRITGTGAISVGSTGTAYGAAGEVLTSNGNASPSWQAGGSSPFGQALKTYSTSANVVVATTVNASTVASKVSGHIIITASTGGGIITKTIGIYETSNLWFYDLATPEIENSNNSIVITPSGNATNTLTFTVGVTNPVAGYGMTVSIQASPPGFFNL